MSEAPHRLVQGELRGRVRGRFNHRPLDSDRCRHVQFRFARIYRIPRRGATRIVPHAGCNPRPAGFDFRPSPKGEGVRSTRTGEGSVQPPPIDSSSLLARPVQVCKVLLRSPKGNNIGHNASVFRSARSTASISCIRPMTRLTSWSSIAISYHASNKHRPKPKGLSQPECIGSNHCNVDLESVYSAFMDLYADRHKTVSRPISLTFCLTSCIGYARLHVEYWHVLRDGRNRPPKPECLCGSATYAFGLCRAITKTAGWKPGATEGSHHVHDDGTQWLGTSLKRHNEQQPDSG